MNFLKLSPYKPEPIGHGGEKRSYQIDHFLRQVIGASSTGVFNSIYQPSKVSRKSLYYLHKFLKGWLLSRSLREFHKFKPNEFVPLCLAHAHYSELISDNDEDFIVWEMGCGYPGSWDYMIPFVERGQKKILAVLHNMDSLIDGRVFMQTDLFSPHWFHKELAALKACELVLTISWEEHWILKLHGINSIYYPYYPIGAVASVSSRVKTLRSNKEQKGFLVLGSAVNLPTYKATLELMEHLKQEKLHLYIAGYGTEKLRDKVNGFDNANILGALSQVDLERVLSEVKAVIIYSLPTTGALTKIPEVLSCGVPVFVNDFGARSYFGLSGLTIYYNFDGLKQILAEKSLPLNVAYDNPNSEQLNALIYKVKTFFESK
jgi:hypothetical protein